MTPNSRSYLNRWLQPDSIIPDPYNPLDYDRYSYVRNNPIKYTDPSGHDPCTDGTFHSFCPPRNFKDYDPKYYAYMYYADTHESNISGNIDMWEPSGAHASAELVKFILDWEKYETTPYDDGFGNCTVGFGHLIGGACTQNINDDYKGKDFWVYYNLFHDDLHQAEAGVRSAFQGLDNLYYPGSSGYPLGGKAPINQSQFDALVDFSYQMGAGNVANLINNHLISSSNGVPFRDDSFRIALTVTFSDASGIGVRRQQEVEIFFNGNYNSAH